MKIPISSIITENFFTRLSNFSNKNSNFESSASKMLDRSDKINPLDVTLQHKKGTNFKEDQSKFLLNKSKNEFNSGIKHNAEDRFQLERQLKINKI